MLWTKRELIPELTQMAPVTKVQTWAHSLHTLSMWEDLSVDVRGLSSYKLSPGSRGWSCKSYKRMNTFPSSSDHMHTYTHVNVKQHIQITNKMEHTNISDQNEKAHMNIVLENVFKDFFFFNLGRKIQNILLLEISIATQRKYIHLILGN